MIRAEREDELARQWEKKMPMKLQKLRDQVKAQMELEGKSSRSWPVGSQQHSYRAGCANSLLWVLERIDAIGGGK